ncbi:Predicted acetyltransferase, GNAT superfamily [Sinosporangium album]|uniref:Predicted acetyltransferase, GNAT superfamily n=1 Tax=Sinosporangium album TaxID=504805 RepID=A0A1G7TKE4_9ACTN|nr:GNAT family N-acetyltransferase [Sinosporangium album]SDG35796.1 Predicted acetyltransferase, GNAT superfamily [Sinosporangium album]
MSAPELGAAWQATARACDRAEVEVRILHEIEEIEGIFQLFVEIWHPSPATPPITVDLMRAMSHAGNYVSGAFQGGKVVGGSVAFLATPPGITLHSHITGASVGRGIGFALKVHQRAWAMERGLERISWTYDPLVRRNAYFNLVKLGARPAEYLPRFYGAMDDAINAGDESDRILAEWQLNAPHVAAAAAGAASVPRVPGDAVVGLANKEGRPVIGDADGPTVLVAVPEDIESLRRTDPVAAGMWRGAVREVLGELMAGGAAVVGFTREAGYVVDRNG